MRTLTILIVALLFISSCKKESLPQDTVKNPNNYKVFIQGDSACFINKSGEPADIWTVTALTTVHQYIFTSSFTSPVSVIANDTFKCNINSLHCDNWPFPIASDSVNEIHFDIFDHSYVSNGQTRSVTLQCKWNRE